MIKFPRDKPPQGRTRKSSVLLMPLFLVLLLAVLHCDAASSHTNSAPTANGAHASAPPPSLPPMKKQPPPMPEKAGTRIIYMIRHAESFKNTLGNDDPENDNLTPLGWQQANFTAHWLSSRPGCCTAVLSAAEYRCLQTSMPILADLNLTNSSLFVDPNMTSKLGGASKERSGKLQETPQERAIRGQRAIQAFLSKTHGDVVIVSHGQARRGSARVRALVHATHLAA